MFVVKMLLIFISLLAIAALNHFSSKVRVNAAVTISLPDKYNYWKRFLKKLQKQTCFKLNRNDLDFSNRLVQRNCFPLWVVKYAPVFVVRFSPLSKAVGPG